MMVTINGSILSDRSNKENMMEDEEEEEEDDETVDNEVN